MFRMHRRFGFGFAAALLALAPATPARAGDSASYLARYEIATADGVVRSTETLNVRRERTTSFVSVSNSDGALLSLPTEFAADGEILANSFDPSVTCYNMAMAALYATAQAPARPSPVFVRLGNDTIAVPVAFKESSVTGGDRMFVGSGAQAMTITRKSDSQQLSGGMVVDARIHLSNGELSDAVFDEATVFGSPAKPLSRMTCSLARAGLDAPPEPKAPDTLPG